VGEVSTSVNLRFCNVDYLKEIKIACIIDIKHKAKDAIYGLCKNFNFVKNK